MLISFKNLVDKMNQYRSHGENALREIFGYLISLIISSFFVGILQSQNVTLQGLIGNSVLVSVTGIIYEKVIRLSHSKLAELSTGEVYKIIQTDVQNLYNFFNIVSNIILIFVNFCFAMLMIFRYLGYLGALTIFSVSVYFIFVSIFFQKIRKINNDFLQAQDKRLKYSNEIFSNIKSVKMNDWGPKFEGNISIYRKNELNYLYYILLYKVIIMISTNIFPQFANILNFAFAQMLGKTLTIGSILAIMNLIASLTNSFSYIPYITTALNQAFSSSKKIEKVFDLINDEKQIIQKMNDINYEYAISIDNCSFEWKKNKNTNKIPTSYDTEEKQSLHSQENPSDLIISKNEDEGRINKRVLTNINLQVKKGELIFIIGNLGSGKSSLIHALNNDLITIQNEHRNHNENECPIKINGKVAYVDQNPWLQSMSIKNNICFLFEYEEAKFKKTIKVCQLEEDLKWLKDDIYRNR